MPVSWFRGREPPILVTPVLNGELTADETMKIKPFACLALPLLAAGNSLIATAFAQGTAFTYQGQLLNSGSPSSGFYDFVFSLSNAPSGGSQVGGSVTNLAVGVTNGLFTTPLNFGAVFTGNPTWLAISVRTNGTGVFAGLTPLQPLTPTPYALFANTASNVSGMISAAQLSGTVPLAQLPGAVVMNNATSVTFTNVSVGDNLYLPATTFSAGIIYSGGSPYIFANGSGNFFAGTIAGNLSMSGNDNTGIGYEALGANNGGTFNTAVGELAMYNNGYGGYNAAFGAKTLGNNLSGAYNVADGVYALWFNSYGSYNTALGYQALYQNQSAASYNIALGALAGYNILNGSSNIDIGNQGLSTDTNIIRLGSGQTQTFIAGLVTGNGGGLTNLSTTNFSGIIPLAQLPGAVVTNNASGLTLTGIFSGNGAGLTNLNTAAWSGNFWQTGGNSGTTPGVNFLGTVDNQPVELWANGGRVLRLEPGGASTILGNGIPTGAPNVIGGSPVNFVASGVVGAVIGGGGATNWGGFRFTNSISALSDFSVLGGGLGNTILSNAMSSTISGGGQNLIQISSDASVIGGGNRNTIQSYAGASVIGGGEYNTVQSNAIASVIGGGWFNRAANGFASVGGGYLNTASGSGAVVGGGGADGNDAIGNTASGAASVVGGGLANAAIADYAHVGGGAYNTASGIGSFIGGGGLDNSNDNAPNGNTASGPASVVGGGEANVAGGKNVTVGGGNANAITSDYATIGGGDKNAIQNNADHSTIGGGQNNTIYMNAYVSFIGGGQQNTVQPGAAYSAVGGGFGNLIGNNAAFSTIAGGYGNSATGAGAVIGGGGYDGYNMYGNVAGGIASVISGGFGNTASGSFATVPGGELNIAAGRYSFAAGQQAQATKDGAFVWADSQNAVFASTANDQFFLIRARGGVGLNTASTPDSSFCINTNTYLFSHAIYLRGETGTDHNHGLAYCGADAPNFGPAVLPNGPVLWGYAGGALGASFGGQHAVLTWNTGGIVVNGYATFTSGGSNTMTLDNSGNLQCAGTVYSRGLALTSDRNAKENFKLLDGQSVLAKVAALPITKWNYRTDSKDVQHVGPMAQDFHAAFQVNGGDDTHISVVDEGGVALAAIQGLNQKVEAKEARIQEQSAEIADLRTRLEKLEQLVSHQIRGAE